MAAGVLRARARSCSLGVGVHASVTPGSDSTHDTSAAGLRCTHHRVTRHAAVVRMSRRYTALFNIMELPCTQVPVYLTPRDRLPVGVQVIGAHGRDHLTIRVAQELARALGVDRGLQPPPAALAAAWQSNTAPVSST